ncbi:MAG: hypothetical protein ACLQU4_10805 [Limisphaerales bacterium]
MKVLSLIVLATFISFHPAHADDTNGPSSGKIAATSANKHYGENAIVTGRVAQVTIRPSVVFLNLEQPYPDSPCTVVIFRRFTNQFGDLSSLSNQSVEISGLITNYQNKPEIVLTNASQLTVSGVGQPTHVAPPVLAQANASPPAPPTRAVMPPVKPDDEEPYLRPTILLFMVAFLAGGLALFLRVRKTARRPELPPASPVLLDSTGQADVPNVQIEMDGSTQTQSQIWLPPTTAGRQADRLPDAVRAGVIANLSLWLKQHVVGRLLSDRADLLATQQAAALKMQAVDERLAKIERHIQERNQDYERRIDELLKALITAEAENREMIRAQITFLKAEMEKTRLKARQQSAEHQQY